MKKERINIVYEDKFIIVVDKPSGLLTIATAREKERTLFHQVLSYLKQKHKANKVFVVHRLDKDTSGIVVFAKSEEVKNKLQDKWNELAIFRGYIAIVEGIPIPESAVLKSYLKETSTFKTFSTKNENEGKEAITYYKVRKHNRKYSLLDIEIKTGRKNQIRVQLSDIGNPIVGDRKYNASSSPINRLALHANALTLQHPITQEIMQFEVKNPLSFENMFKNNK